MYLPNYEDGSIVNLMSSILQAYGQGSEYGPLRNLDIKSLRKATNIILLVLDGLGYEFTLRHGEGGIFNEYLRDKMTSVFPPTTATGITTFLTGLAPQEHGITGWFMLLKELGLVTRILPFNPRYGGLSLSRSQVDPRLIFDHEPMSARISADTFYVIPRNLYESDYTNATSVGAKKVAYDSLDGCLEEITKIVSSTSAKKFIYAYWAEFDALCHECGTESSETLGHFQKLSYSTALFLEALKKSNSIVLITSDHGLVDTKETDRISLKKHPQFEETLTVPLCGEPRVAYCYVHPSKANQFREYAKTKLSNYCTLYNSRDLIKKHFFGLYKPNEKLFDRVGDYVLIMKEHYVIKDFTLGEAEHFLKANHGGVSKEEMFVPLIVATP